MAVIKTKEFSFSKWTYLQILISDTVRRNWWAGLFLVSIAAYQANQKNSMGIIWLAFPVSYFIYVFIRCWMHAAAKKNTLFFTDRYFEIDDQEIICLFKQGTVNKVGINRIARVVKNSRYYRLFLSKKQFIYIPLGAFRTPGDIRWFDDILKARKFIKPQMENRRLK